MLTRKILTTVACLFLALLFNACASEPVKFRGITVAVWDLENLCPSEAHVELGELLATQVIEVLQKREDYTVVERERLLLALEELHLGTTQLADESTRLKLGRLVGARFMVFGGYTIIGNKMRLDLRMVEVETGRVLSAVQKISSDQTLPAMIDTAQRAAQELVIR
jgi:TolB-like protein